MPTPKKSSAGFPGGSVVKNLADNARYMGLIPGSGRSPGGGNGNTLQCSCLENYMDSSLALCSRWGCKDLDTIQRLSMCKRVLDTTDFSTGLGVPQVSTSCLQNFQSITRIFANPQV